MKKNPQKQTTRENDPLVMRIARSVALALAEETGRPLGRMPDEDRREARDNEDLSPTEAQRVVELRRRDPGTYTFAKLAEMFQTTPYRVYEACPKSLRGVGGRPYRARRRR